MGSIKDTFAIDITSQHEEKNRTEQEEFKAGAHNRHLQNVEDRLAALTRIQVKWRGQCRPRPDRSARAQVRIRGKATFRTHRSSIVFSLGLYSCLVERGLYVPEMDPTGGARVLQPAFVAHSSPWSALFLLRFGRSIDTSCGACSSIPRRRGLAVAGCCGPAEACSGAPASRRSRGSPISIVCWRSSVVAIGSRRTVTVEEPENESMWGDKWYSVDLTTIRWLRAFTRSRPSSDTRS